MNKISILILAVCLLLLPYFVYQIVTGINNDAGTGSLIYSGAMILLLFVSAALIVNHWKTEKNNSKQ
ncbi:hypothetical protein M4S82_10680 [Planococcus sp. MERTA32b]|nr:hypothetical protein [Planococcus sp. MER TA 32b]